MGTKEASANEEILSFLVSDSEIHLLIVVMPLDILKVHAVMKAFYLISSFWSQKEST